MARTVPVVSQEWVLELAEQILSGHITEAVVVTQVPSDVPEEVEEVVLHL